MVFKTMDEMKPQGSECKHDREEDRGLEEAR